MLIEDAENCGCLVMQMTVTAEPESKYDTYPLRIDTGTSERYVVEVGTWKINLMTVGRYEGREKNVEAS